MGKIKLCRNLVTDDALSVTDNFLNEFGESIEFCDPRPYTQVEFSCIKKQETGITHAEAKAMGIKLLDGEEESVSYPVIVTIKRLYGDSISGFIARHDLPELIDYLKSFI